MILQAMDEGIALRRACMETLADPLCEAGTLLSRCLENGGKILACGNGGSAADAQHFAAELVNRFETDRIPLPAIALTHDASVITSIANDISFDQVFARQVTALGRAEDVLIAISTSGRSANVVQAVNAALEYGMHVIALTGRDGGLLAQHPGVTIHLNIPHASTARIQEMHITCLHILCTLIEAEMRLGHDH